MGALQASADRHPDKLLYAFLDEDGRTRQSYGYAEFIRRTGEVAAHIHQSRPLAPGERVLLVYPPGLEMISALFACVRMGLIPVPVYPPSSGGFAAALYKMNFIAEDCGASAVLTDRSCYWSLKLHRARASLASFSLRKDYTSRLDWIITSDAESSGTARFPEAHSEILFLQYTSGSTNDPKGVMVSHANVLANCAAVVDHVPVMVSWLPQYHDMGLIAFYLFTPIAGATTYGCSPLDFIRRPMLWLEAITRCRATASAAPNFAYEYCLRPDKVDDEGLQRIDLSSLRVLLSGAEPVKPDVFRGFQRRFGLRGLAPCSFSTAYGLAESTLAVTGRGRDIRSFDGARLRPDDSEGAPTALRRETAKELVSCGRPLGATEVAIVDIERRIEVPEGRVGEIWVAGPSKCLGYWGRPELTEEVFEARLEGDLGSHDDPERTWLRTGDLGFVEGGELFVCGRAKDVIIVRGANYYPQDIEAIVEEDPAVRRGCVAAFGAPDDGYEVVVVAELRNGSRRPDARLIDASVRRRLGIGVELFVFIPKRTIPKTSSGKISRHRALRAWRENSFRVVHTEETGCPDSPRGAREGAGAHDAAHTGSDLSRLFRAYGLSGREERTLAESGLDSVAAVDFSLDVERHLQGHAGAELADGIDLRWLQAMPVCELFELLDQIDQAAPGAKLRFRKTLAALGQEHAGAERDLMRRDARLALEAPERGPPRAGARGAGSVLLTGGTGFFGPFLLRSLLEQTDDLVQVLVRADSEDHARVRIERGLASLGLEGDVVRAWHDRVQPLCGDLELPNFGLSPVRWSSLSDSVDAIYHNGALVNYVLDYASMRSANVGATNEVIRLTWSGRPKVLNHISTTFVFGWSTKETLCESDTNADMALLDFGYSQSKWVSEQLVLAAMERGMPARVFRPALITPSVTGDGYNFDIAIRLLAFMLHHGLTTTAQNQVSFTPADIAANNVVAISRLPDTVGETFHVTRDVYAGLQEVTRIMGELTGTDFVSYGVDDFVANMIERCRKGDLLFPLVSFFVRSADNITAMEFKRYDSRNYRAARERSPHGLSDPPLEDVVGGILRFMARQGIIEVPAAHAPGSAVGTPA